MNGRCECGHHEIVHEDVRAEDGTVLKAAGPCMALLERTEDYKGRTKCGCQEFREAK